MPDKLTSQELKTFLWDAANILRGKIDSGDFKNYILGMLFYKRLSDVYDEEFDKMKTSVGEKLAKNKDLYGDIFYIPDGCHWNDILQISRNVGEKINDVFVKTTRANAPKLDGLLDKIDFNDKDRLSDEAVSSLVNHFNIHRLGRQDVNGDLLGDAYEYLIAQFADDAGKKGGEFYTPHMVVELLTRILDPKEGESIYDPASGSNGMLITAADVLKRNGGNPNKLFFYGQEQTYNTYILGKMNMILHGYMDAQIERGDSFSEPKHVNPDGSLKKFDIVLTNPPWNQDMWFHSVTTNNGKKKVVEREDHYNRFIYGRPPAGSGDWGWLQLMLASLKPKGRMGIVMDNGVLFRGSAEGKVREAFIKNDLIDTVIGLSNGLFTNTGSPACLLICSRKKPDHKKGKIFFIDASKDFQEGKAKNYLREEDVTKTVNTFHDYKTVERYCSVVDFNEIKENDYNLNISRYVDTAEPEEPVYIPDVIKKINELEMERETTKLKLNNFLNELGYK